MPGTASIELSREFDAPREALWAAWTDPKRFKRWYGPKTHEIVSSEIDVRPGGSYLYCMRGPDGGEFWATGTYREVDPPSRLVLTEVTADEEGNVVPMSDYGMPGEEPMELEIEVTLEETGDGRTQMRLRASGFPGEEMSQGASMGWEQAFDKLAAALASPEGV